MAMNPIFSQRETAKAGLTAGLHFNPGLPTLVVT